MTPALYAASGCVEFREGLIDFPVQVEEIKGSNGERRIRIIFDGKALPYSDNEGWAPPTG